MKANLVGVLCAGSMLALGSGCNRDHGVPVAPKAALTSDGSGPADRIAGTDSSIRRRSTNRRAPSYSKDVAPLVDQYCLNCHDSAAAEGGINLESLAAHGSSNNQRSLLIRVADNLRSESEPRPGAVELETINSWLDTVLSVDDGGAGRVAIRRLNRAEYNNTIRDLIGLDLHPADDFPSDDVGSGFDNIGAVLSTPPVLLERYLAAAEKVVGEAFRSPAVRDQLMKPTADAVPRAFRRYTPPVRSPRADKVFRPVSVAPDPELARQQRLYDILRGFADRAFRRPATHEELTRLLGIVLAAEKDGEPHELALQPALRAVLVSPHFLFLGVPPGGDQVPSDSALPPNDFDLAERLSYFLWSSMPDLELERHAARGALRRGDNLRTQVGRLLQDRREHALAQNFAGQWLQTRKLKEFVPDPHRFPDFDESLRQSMLTETEMFFDSIREEDRSVLDFLDADHAFVNERLTRHYGVSGVSGGRFRRVSLQGTERRGILTQASILTVTSNPTRTSPVKRRKWILENILGSPPSPPPSGVEALKEGPGLKADLRPRSRARARRPAGCGGDCSQSRTGGIPIFGSGARRG
jgi:Protein of unknown function (DUF1592)/Protein of unknown function (DUF1587)/Protein of unknown function (DUF1595)/Protein of unknown function (DUF1588)